MKSGEEVYQRNKEVREKNSCKKLGGEKLEKEAIAKEVEEVKYMKFFQYVNRGINVSDELTKLFGSLAKLLANIMIFSGFTYAIYAILIGKLTIEILMYVSIYLILSRVNGVI